ncbi:MAG: hypothetical protein EAX86_00945 [Candidatus Heimdallarchaeota archaeon]|nr:hypothetical protein [Candidatus Heimdallarchaeota archaeon]
MGSGGISSRTAESLDFEPPSLRNQGISFLASLNNSRAPGADPSQARPRTPTFLFVISTKFMDSFLIWGLIHPNLYYHLNHLFLKSCSIFALVYYKLKKFERKLNSQTLTHDLMETIKKVGISVQNITKTRDVCKKRP